MRLFICSDIHSHYTELQESLAKAGYNPNNSKHKLIILGDFFDKGSEALKVKEFLLESKAVFIRGNHDDCLMRIYETEFIKNHDYADGTFDTMKQLAGCDSNISSIILSEFKKNNENLMNLYQKMPYYYTYNDILFVHSWFPDDIFADKEIWHKATLTRISQKIKYIKENPNISFEFKKIVFGHHKADAIEGLERYKGKGVHTEMIRTLKTKNVELYAVDGRVQETNKIPVLIMEV